MYIVNLHICPGPLIRLVGWLADWSVTGVANLDV